MPAIESKRIGLIVGSERSWPDAFMAAVNARDVGVTAELVKLGGTFMSDPAPYDLIIDQMSHDIPYYRAYLKHAMLHGTYVINNPYVLDSDDKFFGLALARKLGYGSIRTALLPNKRVEAPTVPDSFRNLSYPMDWDGIVDYVGVPAILKDVHTGGRRIVFRVHDVDELIARYDESDTLNMVLQELLDADVHIHCFVIGQERVLPLYFSLEENGYLPDRASADDALITRLSKAARHICRAYRYDLNMVEFITREGQPFLVNPTNPVPDMSRALLGDEAFAWCVEEMATFAIERVKNPVPQATLFDLPLDG